jgi:hypothetical protein
LDRASRRRRRAAAASTHRNFSQWLRNGRQAFDEGLSDRAQRPVEQALERLAARILEHHHNPIDESQLISYGAFARLSVRELIFRAGQGELKNGASSAHSRPPWVSMMDRQIDRIANRGEDAHSRARRKAQRDRTSGPDPLAVAPFDSIVRSLPFCRLCDVRATSLHRKGRRHRGQGATRPASPHRSTSQAPGSSHEPPAHTVRKLRRLGHAVVNHLDRNVERRFARNEDDTPPAPADHL